MPYYGDDLRVAHKLRHTMDNTENPFCSSCGFRKYPSWLVGEHECISKVEVARIRHVAGDMISNLHFYRIPPAMQVAALAEALCHVVGTNVQPGDFLDVKWKKLKDQMTTLIYNQSERVEKASHNPNPVQDINRKRSIVVKKKKGGPDAPRCKNCDTFLHGRCRCGWHCPCYNSPSDKDHGPSKRKKATRDVETAGSKSRKRLKIRRHRS